MGEDKGTRKLAEGINFANGKNTTATVEDGKVVYSLNDALTDLTSVTARDTTGNQTPTSKFSAYDFAFSSSRR